MDKDRVKGKAKDISGRIERQVGEWTGDEEKQVHGAGKQVEGKIQNAFGNAKDALKKPRTPEDREKQDQEEEESDRLRRHSA